MHLGLRQLEIFQLFTQTRSVTDTARLLRVSQPAVSLTLKELEAQLGFAVFARIGGRTRLTDEAMLILPQVERLLAQMTSLKGYAAELRDSRAGSLSIAAVAALTAEIIPAAVQLFLQERQHVMFRIEEHNAAEVAQEIKQERVDLGFAFAPIDEAGIASEAVMRASLVCIVPKDHPFCGAKIVTMKDLKNETVIVQGHKTISGFALREGLGQAADNLRIYETNNSITALHMVRHGLGVALISPLVLASDTGGGTVPIPFAIDIPMTLAVLYSRHRPVSRLMMHFVAYAKKSMKVVADDLQSRGLACEVLP